MHYMSIGAIDEMLGWIDAHTTENCTIISRDTVSLLGESFHRSERYSNNDPAIYRLVEEYESRLSVYGWSLAQSWPTYAPPRFAWLHSVLPQSWRLRLQQKELRVLPEQIRKINWRNGSGDKQHCFFVYRR